MGLPPQSALGGNTITAHGQRHRSIGCRADLHGIMRKVHEGQPVQWYDRPATIINKTVVCQVVFY